MHKQSNTYTIVYASVMVSLVAAVLAVTSLSLKEKQTRNVEIDKMKQILSSVHIAATADDAQSLYKKYIVDSYVLGADGKPVDGADAFGVDVAVQVKLPAAERRLPVYVRRLDELAQKSIGRLDGAGQWCPRWG